MLKRYYSVVLTLVLSTNLLIGQTFEQTLDRYKSATQQLDELNKIDNLLDNSIDIEALQTNMLNVVKDFQALNKIQNEYKLASGYYSVLSVLKLAEVYDASLELEKAYTTLTKISQYVNGSISIPVPIYFNAYGSKYQITAENLSALKNEYYKLMQNLTYYQSKYDELKETVKSQIALNSANYSIAEGLLMLFQLDNDKIYTLNADDKIFFYSSYLYVFSKLSSNESSALINSKRYIYWNTIAQNMLSTALAAPVSNTNTSNIAKALYAIIEVEKHSESLIDLFQYTLTNFYLTTNYQGTVFAFNSVINPYNYYEYALKLAQNAVNDQRTNDSYLNSALNILTAPEKEKASKLALTALQKMADYAVEKNNCDKLQFATDNMNKWGFAAEYAKYSALIAPCQLAVKKENERKARELKRANSKTNIYLGAYPLGLFTKPEKMDFGAALNFVTAGKSALELSFLKINQKRDNYFDIWMMEKKYKAEDLSLWDGYYAHVQYKIFNNSGKSGLYNGILLGYSDKDFAPMTVKTVDISTNAEKDETFDPTLQQTILMINEGFMGLYKGVGFDFFAGVGATYNRYNSGNTTYNSTTHNIVDNNVLQYRKKEYFSFIMRIGVTVGLNLGNGNRR